MEVLPTSFFETVEINLPSFLTLPIFSLLVIIFVFLTFAPDPFRRNMLLLAQAPTNAQKRLEE